MMNSTARMLFAGAFAAAALAMTVAPASAWTRNSSVTTPRGTYTGSASGECAYGAGCQRGSTWTGPNGGTVNHQGSAYATGNGSINYGGSTTGPNGGTVSRGGTISRY